jgi:hypothetical protein
MSAPALAVLVMAFAPLVGAAAERCRAQSGERTAALVELYTAEDCRSCAPADRWLAGLGGRYAVERVVAVALQVDARDYLGAKKPDAQYRVGQRKGTLSLLQRMALVYSPQVVLQGREFADWPGAAFDAAVARINAQPTRARLELEIRSLQAAELAAAVQAEIVDPAQRRDAVVYVGTFHARPAKAPVVLAWQGPFSPGPDGRFAERRSLPLLPGATPASSGVAAFVQNRRTAEVLQAVLLAACSP